MVGRLKIYTNQYLFTFPVRNRNGKGMPLVRETNYIKQLRILF